MMYVYIIRKIIIVTIVKFNLILIQTINLISVKFFFISFQNYRDATKFFNCLQNSYKKKKIIGIE